jgi:uncharacterized repeat protein (TIGR04076 family)
MSQEVKITVIATKTTDDIYTSIKDYPAKLSDNFVPVCPILKVGDEYIVKDIVTCPEGFCAWAFADIQRDIIHLQLGGDFPWLQDKGTNIACCTDGLRPVFFKLEKM